MLSQQMSNYIEETSINEWITKEKTTLIQKDSKRESSQKLYIDNVFTCDVENPTHTNKRNILLGSMPRTISRIIEKMPQMNERNKWPTICKSAHPLSQNNAEKVAVVWIDYKRAYDIVQQTRILECLKMYKISDHTQNFISHTLKNWKVELIAEGQTIAEVKIQRGIFKRFSLWPLLFLWQWCHLITHLGAQGAANFQNHRKKLITLCT